METKRIRIGNDICLAVDLRQYIGGNYLLERDVYNPEDTAFEDLDSNPYVNKSEVYYGDQYANQSGTSMHYTSSSHPISIRSAKAFLINTTRQNEKVENAKKRNRFIARFPIEPYIESFTSTPYDICNSGYPTWRAYPRKYMFMPYHGFGLHPEWGGIYKPLPMVNDTKYTATVRATSKQNIVEVVFPAEHQLHVGKYTLVLVVKVFAPGYNSHNLKTIAVDIPDVFELVKTTEEGIDTGISADVQNVYDNLPGGDSNVSSEDIYTVSGQVPQTLNNDVIVLNRTDGASIYIDTSSITGWHEGD